MSSFFWLVYMGFICMWQQMHIGWQKIMRKQKKHLRKLQKDRKCSPRIQVDLSFINTSNLIDLYSILLYNVGTLTSESGLGMLRSIWNLQLFLQRKYATGKNCLNFLDMHLSCILSVEGHNLHQMHLQRVLGMICCSLLVVVSMHMILHFEEFSHLIDNFFEQSLSITSIYIYGTDLLSIKWHDTLQ